MWLFDIPLHPKFVHFPIALFVSAWILEMLSLVFKKEPAHKAAMYVYIMAALSSVFAVVSGLWEANRLHLQHPLLFAHRNYALAVFIISGLSLVLVWAAGRKSPAAARAIFTCACVLCAALIVAVGYFGGKMVYGYGIGVSP